MNRCLFFLGFLLNAALICPQIWASDGTVLVTGANRGLGLALTQEFIDRGFNVVGTARDPDSAESLNKTGARVLQLDVTSEDSVANLASELDGLPIDILINNAGILGDNTRIMNQLDVDDVRRVLDVNTLGPIRVIKALYPNTLAGDSRIVINVSSMMGSNELNTWGGHAGYRASKAALNAVNTTFAHDFAKDNVIFVLVHPGYVQTDINDGRGEITPRESANGLADVISSLKARDNGKFYDWQGKELPW